MYPSLRSLGAFQVLALLADRSLRGAEVLALCRALGASVDLVAEVREKPSRLGFHE